MTELKAWVLVFEAVLSAPRVFVREIAPYMLSRWKVRYIVNPVLSTLSRRSLYQFPPGCMLHHFIISLFLARITRFPVSFAPTAILFLLFPLPTFVSTALPSFSLTFPSFPSCVHRAYTAIRSRYTCQQPPFFHSGSTLHYRFIPRSPSTVSLSTDILEFCEHLGNRIVLFSLYRVTTFDVNWTISEKIWIGRTVILYNRTSLRFNRGF